MAASKDIFISYRRDTGAELAEIIKKDLGARGYSVFKDTHDLKAGHWQEDLSRQINGCKDFILLVTPGALDRCKADPDDVVLFEIRLALAQKKNFILVVKRGKGQTPEEAFKELPSSISDLPKHNWIEYTNEDSDAKLKKIRSFLDSSPSVWELASNRYGKQLLAGVICGGLLLCGLLAWGLFGRTGRIENKVGEIAGDTTSILQETGIIRRGVDDLGKLGGIRKNPISVEDFIHNGRINELSGNLKEATENYKRAVNQTTEFVDINLIYFDLLKSKNGLEGATLEFAEVTKANKDSAPVACVTAMGQKLKDRRLSLRNVIARNPDYAPAYYLLATTFSPKVLPVASPLAAEQERKNLKEFRRLNELGLAKKHYFNRDIYENAIEDSNIRLNNTDDYKSIMFVNFDPLGGVLRTSHGFEKAFVSFNSQNFFEMEPEKDAIPKTFRMPYDQEEAKAKKLPIFNPLVANFSKKKTSEEDLNRDLVLIKKGKLGIYVRLIDNTDLEYGPVLLEEVGIESLANSFDENNNSLSDMQSSINDSIGKAKEGLEKTNIPGLPKITFPDTPKLYLPTPGLNPNKTSKENKKAKGKEDDSKRSGPSIPGGIPIPSLPNIPGLPGSGGPEN